MDEIIVISLGGSLIVPNEIDVQFLKDFKDLILKEIENGKKFAIITGGGKISRKYVQAAKEIDNPSDYDLDWIGIASLRLNAELVRTMFGKFAHKEVIFNLSEDFPFEKPILVGGAYKPGQSSDWNAVLAAKTLGSKKVINLSNTDYVYDSDPKVNPEAKKLDEISWANYRVMIPGEWKPGMNTPFDPIASEMAQKEGIKVVVMNGKPLENVAKCIRGDKFIGTIIS